MHEKMKATALVPEDAVADVQGQSVSADSGSRVFGNRFKEVWSKGFVPLAVYALLVALWEGGLRLFPVDSYLVPRPSQIAVAMWNGLTTGTLLADAQYTLTEALAGLGLAVVVGFVLAAAVVEFGFLRRVLYPLLIGLQSLPKIAIAPLLIIWLGFGIETKIVIAALVALFPVLINCITGFQSYSQDAGDLFRSLRASRWETFWRLKVPVCMPMFIAALKTGYIFALLGAIVGEFLGSPQGLGYSILQMQFRLDVASVFSVLIVLALIGVIGERIIDFAGRRLASWSGSAT